MSSKRKRTMKIKGTILYQERTIKIDENTLDQLIFQHKNGKTQLVITTLIDSKPVTFNQEQIQELTVIQITNTDTNNE